jgi:hypothetical protein
MTNLEQIMEIDQFIDFKATKVTTPHSLTPLLLLQTCKP